MLLLVNPPQVFGVTIPAVVDFDSAVKNTVKIPAVVDCDSSVKNIDPCSCGL